MLTIPVSAMARSRRLIPINIRDGHCPVAYPEVTGCHKRECPGDTRIAIKRDAVAEVTVHGSVPRVEVTQAVTIEIL